MWGGMTAVAVRHNRPKHLADGKLRPTNLNLLKTSGLGPGHGPGGTDSPGKLSAAPSRAGSPSHEVLVTPFLPSPNCDTKKLQFTLQIWNFPSTNNVMYRFSMKFLLWVSIFRLNQFFKFCCRKINLV